MAAPRVRLPEILERIKASGLKITRPRERIVATLIASDRPLTADQIRERGHFRTSDLVTIYRNLEAFHHAGVLQRFMLEDGTQLFELTAPDDHFHHLVCRRCHQTTRLDICLGHELEEAAKKAGLSEITHQIEVYGICRDCNEPSQQA